jgi:hypothetical protein
MPLSPISSVREGKVRRAGPSIDDFEGQKATLLALAT